MSVSSLPVIRDEGGIAYIRWLSTTRSDFYPPAASAKDIEEQAYGLAFTVEEMVHLLSTRSISRSPRPHKRVLFQTVSAGQSPRKSGLLLMGVELNIMVTVPFKPSLRNG